jgi:hypothetical protein
VTVNSRVRRAAVTQRRQAADRRRLSRLVRGVDTRAVTDMRTDVILSMNRALWEQVTSDLRGVAVAHRGSADHGSIEARFLYESQVGDVPAECVSMAETYCIADLPPGVSVTFRAVADASRELLPGEQWVFLRWEPNA